MERRYSYDEGMVLRTVYLPKELDERLRTMAHEARTSKNELIRSLIRTGLEVSESRSKAGEAAPQRYEQQAAASGATR